MRNNSLVIMEIIWIITGILAIVMGIHYAINTGGARIIVFAGMAIVSFLFAWIRHRQRKKS
jgi:hypothetical protein